MRNVAKNYRKSCLYTLQIIEMLEQEAKIDDDLNQRQYDIVMTYLEKKYLEAKKEYIKILKEEADHDK